MILNSVASGIFDRVAAQVQMYKFGIQSGAQVGLGLFYPRVHRGSGQDGDFSVENALINSAHSVDINTISGTMFKNLYNSFFNDFETHVLNANSPSFNSWLNISGLNVHPNFEDAWYQTKGQHLNAVNVFFANDNIKVATYTVTSSGAGTYASVLPIGTGTGSVSPTNFAAAKFLVIPSQSTVSGVQINLRLLKEDGQSSGTLSDSANIAITSGVLSGIQLPVNWLDSNSGNYYLDCNNIVALGGYQNDVYNIYAVRERNIVL